MARAKCLGNGDAIAVSGDVFLHDDAVGAFGHGRAGEDAQRLALSEGAVKTMPRGGFADHREFRARAHRCGAHRVAIHGRRREGRLVARRQRILRQHATRGFGQGHGFGV